MEEGHLEFSRSEVNQDVAFAQKLLFQKDSNLINIASGMNR